MRGIKMGLMVSDSALIDGRQSETALLVRRGVQRLLRAHGMMSVAELTLPSGRRADLVALSVDRREAPQHPILAAASRRAVVLRFAQVAAQRLHDLHDPHAATLSV